jgi:hypothetical protein
MHPLCPVIDAHLRAGTPPPTVRRIIEGRGQEAPSTHSIRSHRDGQMRADQAATRRVREVTPLLAISQFITDAVERHDGSDVLLAGGEAHVLYAHYCLCARGRDAMQSLCPSSSSRWLAWA